MSDPNPYNQILGKMSFQQAIDQYLLAKETEGLTAGTLKYYRDELSRVTQYVGGGYGS